MKTLIASVLNGLHELGLFLFMLCGVAVWLIVPMVWAFIFPPVPPVHAEEPLTFGENVKVNVTVSFPTNLWRINGEEEYKNGRLAYYQKLLQEKGVKNPKHLRLLTAQLLVENGAISETVHGDNGCSVGIPQYNTCVHNGMKALRFLEKYPEWKDWKFQMARMADMVAEREALYNGNILQIIVHHNSPAAASRGVDTKAGYYGKVQRMASHLTEA